VAEPAGHRSAQRFGRPQARRADRGWVFVYDAEASAYELPPEHAPWLMGHTARNVAPPVRDAAAASDRVLPPGRGLSRSASSVRSSPSGWDDVWRRVYDEQLHPIWGRGWYCWKCMRLRRPRTTHETGGPDGSGAGPLPDERSPLIASAVGPLPLAITGLACAPSSGTGGAVRVASDVRHTARRFKP
jgi:hypothetical protein